MVMAGSLYELCFAILTLHMGKRASLAIALVMLLAGFAGTIAFPAAHALTEKIVGEVLFWYLPFEHFDRICSVSLVAHIER